MAELHELSALELGKRIATGEISSEEAVRHFAGRIEASSHAPGAFLTLNLDDALARSRAFDEDAARARRAGEVPASPLAGVPTAIKDLNPTPGIRTTFGSYACRDLVPEAGDNIVVRMQAAGLISLGKTNTPEFGTSCYTENALGPAAETPWRAGHMAGGSSGGAATAVAAGLVPLAHGSDGGGSIRIPASCCGLFGFKPSRGRISPAPAYGDPMGLATAGALSRDVRDAAALIDVLAGREPGDPYWAPEATGSFLSACQEAPGRLRIARFSRPIITEAQVHPDCLAAYESMRALLESLGHEVVEIEAPIGPDAAPAFEVCWSVLTALAPLPADQEDDLMPITRWLMDRGRSTGAVEFGRALVELRQIAARALEALAPYDAVLTPTLAQPPLEVGAIRDDEDPHADFEAQKRFSPFTSAWNVTGMPAVSIPTAVSGSGLPIGTMLAGRPGEDHALFSLAAQIETATGFPAWRAPGV
ncbi:amidase [Sediminivirga luteola]|uniref:Amidase n=1 Tax=Sediminivirga luteola TaxID=1774748 RepID=A0A8J2TZZ7_9MICO|nr:amidase [Sediminivirga luteola]MCI2264019.1 amidase [Sediminivirga luteola]GGA23016.1 amidase [Sediminivirga luteola]